ncbi:MAG: hypothetical protein AWU55_1938 [Halomonadaceae bacterium T82-2]|nr:MAG: hypothetical protein AWU55_1938 [Halomonadaceae bacterium T82-2]
MLDALALLMIFIGVAFSIYQLYDIYYDQNFGDDELIARGDVPDMEALAQLAAGADDDAFRHAIRSTFGENVDEGVIRRVLASESRQACAEPLLRRGHRIVFDGGLRVRHLPFWETRPPRHSFRATLLLLILGCCLAVLFMGGLSIYTIAYPLSAAWLSWANVPWILMVVIYGLIALTHLLARLDKYLHDLHELGRLDEPPARDAPLHPKAP